MSTTLVRLLLASRHARSGPGAPAFANIARRAPGVVIPALVRVLLMTAAAAFYLSAACAATRQNAGPRETLSEYARALQDGRVADAYALLSEDAKKNMPFEAFQRMVQENPEEMKEIAEALQRPSGTARVTATVTGPEGEPLLLVYEAGAWRVDGSAIDLYSQDSPEAAIVAFVRAVENKRYDVLLRFVPDAKREGLDAAKLQKAFEGEQREEVERLTQALKAALPTARIERIGNRATMSYGASGTVELVEEAGRWKIEEF